MIKIGNLVLQSPSPVKLDKFAKDANRRIQISGAAVTRYRAKCDVNSTSKKKSSS